ncbi:MAG TPA: D-alanyl-D-alanine carboxypeptidase/D-alanyl-D-alanine-endopeptidase [Longimicrobiales bacterium]|nr:D-alanyl-D-alanine carboxypeptidase/D-alanyl-D-alanine-endopeptidase [Longimicrobiales bacterium]
MNPKRRSARAALLIVLLPAVVGAGALEARTAASAPAAGAGPAHPGPATSPASAADSARIAARLAAVLDTGAMARVHWGIDVRDASTGQVLFGRNAHRLFIPASSLKLVVAAAAAHHLPASFRYRTTFLAGGPLRDGVLEGDLIVRGRGDPTISGRYEPAMTTLLAAFADSLRARGVRRISGAVVADETEWPYQPVHGDWEAYDLNWWYAARVGPLGFNDNAVDFRVAPGAVGQRARITWQPDTRAFHFRNDTRTVAAGRPTTLDFDRVPGTDSIFAYGEIPADASARTESFAVRDPAHYFAMVLAEQLARAGIAIDSAHVRISRPPQLPARGTVLFEYLSPPLARIVGPVLQTSQNWFAEQLVRTLGHEVSGEGSWAAGLAVERRFLSDVVGIDSATFRLRDGSGLSGGNLITPASLSRLLVHVRRDPRQQVVRDALPVSAAETGSLRRRLQDLPGRVQAKTGSIRNVDSLSGLLRTDSGRELAFSIVANGSGVSSARMRNVIDAAVRILAAEL